MAGRALAAALTRGEILLVWKRGPRERGCCARSGRLRPAESAGACLVALERRRGVSAGRSGMMMTRSSDHAAERSPDPSTHLLQHRTVGNQRVKRPVHGGESAEAVGTPGNVGVLGRSERSVRPLRCSEHTGSRHARLAGRLRPARALTAGRRSKKGSKSSSPSVGNASFSNLKPSRQGSSLCSTKGPCTILAAFRRVLRCGIEQKLRAVRPAHLWRSVPLPRVRGHAVEPWLRAAWLQPRVDEATLHLQPSSLRPAAPPWPPPRRAQAAGRRR